MTKYGPWIGWNGRECPVNDGTDFEVATSVGTQEDTTVEGWDWDSDASNPIIAYREVIEPEKYVQKMHYRPTKVHKCKSHFTHNYRNFTITVQGENIKAEWADD